MKSPPSTFSAQIRAFFLVTAIVTTMTAIGVGVIAVLAAVLMLEHASQRAHARELDGRHANSTLKPWFDSLKSGKGPCCSDADGTALSDVDWRSADGHYQVRIADTWIDVPENAVLTGPNLIGRTMVWPIYYNSLSEPVCIEIRCFLPGSMT